MLNKSRLVLALTLLMVIPACGSNPLSLLTGGSGTSVTANVPIAAGQEVEQTQGISVKTEAPSVSLRPKSRVDTVDQSQNKVQADEVKTVVVNETPVWLILALVLGWLFPSPGEIGRWVRKLLTRK